MQKSRRSHTSSSERLSLKSSVSRKSKRGGSISKFHRPVTTVSQALNYSLIKFSLHWKANSLLETDERLCNPFSDLKASSDIKTPMSAGYLHKKSFFQNFPNKNRFKLTRSESERKLPPVKQLEKQDSTLTGIYWINSKLFNAQLHQSIQ